MPLYYNIKPANVPIIIKVGDTLNIGFDVYLNLVLFDMTGMDIDIKFKRKDGLLVKSISSTGVTPEVTIIASHYIMDSDGFLASDVLDYDVQVTDGTDIFTIQEGEVYVKKQIT